MALNILPIPPLDGGRVLAGLLPARAASILARIEPYGLFVILGLLFAGLLDNLMRPLIRGAERLIAALVGL
jgi:Zn-dependent protease